MSEGQNVQTSRNPDLKKARRWDVCEPEPRPLPGVVVLRTPTAQAVGLCSTYDPMLSSHQPCATSNRGETMKASVIVRVLIAAAFAFTGALSSAPTTAQSKPTKGEGAKQSAESSEGWSTDGMEPQAAVVHRFYHAMETDDVDAYYATQSAKNRKKIDDFGRKKALAMWRKNTLRRLRVDKLDPEKFEYEYEGGAEEGAVQITYDGKNLGDLDVTKSENGWRISES